MILGFEPLSCITAKYETGSLTVGVEAVHLWLAEVAAAAHINTVVQKVLLNGLVDSDLGVEEALLGHELVPTGRRNFSLYRACNVLLKSFLGEQLVNRMKTIKSADILNRCLARDFPLEPHRAEASPQFLAALHRKQP